jgi:hypothetical protein
MAVAALAESGVEVAAASLLLLLHEASTTPNAINIFIAFILFFIKLNLMR